MWLISDTEDWQVVCVIDKWHRRLTGGVCDWRVTQKTDRLCVCDWRVTQKIDRWCVWLTRDLISYPSRDISTRPQQVLPIQRTGRGGLYVKLCLLLGMLCLPRSRCCGACVHTCLRACAWWLMSATVNALFATAQTLRCMRARSFTGERPRLLSPVLEEDTKEKGK